MTPRQPAPRTQVRRLPGKQVGDRAALDALLECALVGHAAVVEDGQPFVMPVAIAPDGERVLCHGSTASRLFRALADGASTCLTITVVDGVVLARSQFESSMHYRSAVLLGRCSTLSGRAKERALGVLTEHLMPGRSPDARGPSAKELAATTVLALPITEWSLKVSDGPPHDDPSDLDRPIWAGTVALQHLWGAATPAPDLVGGHQVPRYVAAWPGGRT